MLKHQYGFFPIINYIKGAGSLKKIKNNFTVKHCRPSKMLCLSKGNFFIQEGLQESSAADSGSLFGPVSFRLFLCMWEP